MSLSAPTTQASGVTYTSNQYDRLSFSWTNGSGSKRAVFMKQGSSGNPSPVDGTTYTENSVFGLGTQISSSGWYTVYNGVGTSTTVTGLTQGTSYIVAVNEYNGVGTNQTIFQTASASLNPVATTTYTPAVLYVNYSTGNDSTGDGSSGSPYKTFHKAYTSANPGDTINASGTFSWGNADETGDAVTSGYTIAKNISIVGNGTDTTTFQATSSDNVADRRVFTINSGVNFSLSNATVRYGKNASNGGCISQSGSSTLMYLDIYGCRSTGGSGGGISNTGTSTIYGSEIHNNVAFYTGGGLSSSQSATTSMFLTNNTIYSNNITASGGAFYGAGVYIGTGRSYLTNNTIVYNAAIGSYGIGGGTYVNSSGYLYMSNNLMASNTVAYYTGTNDWYLQAGGTVVSGGHNIIGRGESYTWATTGDWTDANSDTVFVQNTTNATGTVRLVTPAALNSGLNGTKTYALSAGSIAINNGTTTANDIVSIPLLDQRGASRSGAVDIGAYEYDGSITDTTAPVISNVASSTTDTTITITWNTDEAATSTFSFGPTISYGSTVVNATATTSHMVSFSSLTPSTTYNFMISVADSLGNVGTSTNYTVSTTAVPDTTAPVISNVASSTTATSITITWNTNEAATSSLQFGETVSYGSTVHNATATTSHMAMFTDLATSTSYHFKINVADTSGNIASSTDYTVTTSEGPDVVSPIVSLTAPTHLSTVQGSVSVSASSTDAGGVAGVSFYVNNTLQGSEDTTYPYGFTWDTTMETNGSYDLIAVSRDTSGNAATSTTVTVTVSNSGSTPTSVTATPSMHGAVITWNTAALASSQVVFGLTDSYGSSTLVQDTAPRVISHSVTLAGLPKCTLFHYVVTGSTGGGAHATSSDNTFYTSGCSGDASVTRSGFGNVTRVAGGTVSDDRLSISVPVNFTATSSAALFQTHKLNHSTFFSNVSKPSGKEQVGNSVFNLKALVATDEVLSTFDEPITVTLTYESSDVSGIDPETLWIHRYDGSDWYPLSDCVTNTTSRTVSCTTTAFSDFSIFGTPVVSATVSTTSAAPTGYSTVVYGCKDPQASNYQVFVAHNQSLCVYTSTSAALYKRNLSVGSKGEDVKKLQQYLNAQGFVITTKGAGSPGQETTVFGMLTKKALIKWQISKNIIPATGTFGPKSREAMAKGNTGEFVQK